MQQTQIFKLSILLISTSLVSSPLFGGESPCKRPIDLTPITICKGEPICDLSKKNEEAPVTLQETLERTYMQNATLDAARAGLRAQDENVAIANGDWRPSLGVVGQQKFEQDYNKKPTSRSRTNLTGYTATVAQNIYNGGATEANIEQAENETFAEKAGLFSTEQNVLFSAVEAHANVIANQDIVKYRQDSVSFYKRFHERTQARFEVGEVGRTDVEAALAEYEGAKGDLSVAIGNLEASKAAYFQIVASSPENLAQPNIILELPRSFEDALEVARNNNPTITEQRFALEAAQYNVDVQFAGLLPKLDVEGSVGNNRRGGTGADTHPTQTALTAAAILNVPIYQKGIPSAQIRQAYQRVAQQKVNVIQTLRQVEQDTRTSWENHIAAREALKGYMAAVKAGEVAVEGGMAEADVGQKTVVDVLVIQDQLIKAQIELVEAQKKLVTTSYQVLQAMGSLMAATLKLDVRYYNPDDYYEEYKDAWIQFWQGEDWRYVKDEVYGPICR